MNPKYSFAYNNLGTSYFGLGDLSNALSAINKAIELRPAFIYARLNRYRVFLALGNRELARKDCEYARTIEPAHRGVSECIDTLGPPPETAKLKTARVFLEDVQALVSTERTVLPIPAIASEAANLQLALSKFDENNALRSMNKLKELLQPVQGFDEFLQNRVTARYQEELETLNVATSEGAKHIRFIDQYMKANLGDTKTGSLTALREQIDQAITRQAIDGISNTNIAFQDYPNRNGLQTQYAEFIKHLPPVSSPPSDSLDELIKRLGISDTSKYLIVGSADQVVLLYNASPSAPTIWKNVRGDFVYQDDSTSVCFAQASADLALVRFVERTLRHDGAIRLNTVLNLCELSKTLASIDIIAFQRGELLKERENYIATLVRLVEENTFRQYSMLSDYSNETHRRERLSLEIESDLERNARQGYGVLAVSETPALCLIPPANADQLVGLKALVTRERDLIDPNFTADLQFVPTSPDLAFRAMQRRQCGYAIGDSTVLSPLMNALRRDQIRYSFSSVWFDAQQVKQVTFDEQDAENRRIQIEAEKDRQRQAEIKLEQDRLAKKQQAKTEQEAALRAKNGGRARVLMSGIADLVKNLAERRVQDNHFGMYSTWLDRRFADQWESYKVDSVVADFGIVQWNGRPIDAIIVQSAIFQKNRILGKYDTTCFMFGLIDDAEFAMQRELLSVPCESGAKVVATWKTGNKFQSQWRVD